MATALRKCHQLHFTGSGLLDYWTYINLPFDDPQAPVAVDPHATNEMVEPSRDARCVGVIHKRAGACR